MVSGMERVPIEDLNQAEWDVMVDAAARRHLGLDREEFRRRLACSDWEGFDHVRLARVLSLVPGYPIP
jgi:hypothetical protein